MSELKSLNQLRLICIENLENVRDVELVSKGKFLEEKEYLQSLALKWRQSGGGGDKSMMEGLQPNRTLKELLVEGYGAKEFPSWMFNDYDGLGSWLPNLIKIEISGCFRCNILPPFSQLPYLKSLKLDDMNEVVELKDASSTMPVLFPSLESLRLSRMPKLKKMWRMEGPSFSQLSKLEIHDCINLASLELHSSSLSKLEIHDCSILASLAPYSSYSLFELEIHSCSNLASLELSSSHSLFELKIRYCTDLASLELHSSPSLYRLEIYNCDKLASFELHSCPSLSRLCINGCPNLAFFSVAPLPSLETISLYDKADDVISLPQELQHFSGLIKLQIYACPALQSLELLSLHSLSELSIKACPNLASLNVASLTRLEKLRLHGVKAEVLRQLMFVSASSSLKFLCIWGIDGMISVPEEPVQYVSTLKTLYIV